MVMNMDKTKGQPIIMNLSTLLCAVQVEKLDRQNNLKKEDRLIHREW